MAFHKYNSVKPRTLKDHKGFLDRDSLLMHCMFEILSQYVEGEMAPDFRHLDKPVREDDETEGSFQHRMTWHKAHSALKDAYDFWQEQVLTFDEVWDAKIDEAYRRAGWVNEDGTHKDIHEHRPVLMTNDEDGEVFAYELLDDGPPEIFEVIDERVKANNSMRKLIQYHMMQIVQYSDSMWS
jgi:hypothetical protein